MTATRLDKVQDWMFRQVHERHLVYNACWEDPRCDRPLLELDPGSEVVMITSAGCNALDYLLDHPLRIHCVDVNHRQNALLQLKQSVLERASHPDLFALFGRGHHPEIAALYHEQLRQGLDPRSRAFWDANLHYFQPNGLRQSFYHYGSSGTFAWLVCRYLRLRPALHRQVRRLFDCRTLDEQRAVFPEVERRLLNPLLQWLMNRHLALCLLGVPRSQQHLFRFDYEGGALGFVRRCVRKVFTELPVRDNYFWRVYFSGAYAADCCPNYLKPEYFDFLRDRQARIRTYTLSLSQFLRQRPGIYSHYVLLDHQDWLAANHRAALLEEWRLILRNSRPGTRILLRSAARDIDFLPAFVRERVRFEREATARAHARDRVGTYASTHLAIVQG